MSVNDRHSFSHSRRASSRYVEAFKKLTSIWQILCRQPCIFLVGIALPLYKIHAFPFFFRFARTFSTSFSSLLSASFMGGDSFRYLWNLSSMYGFNRVVWKASWTFLAFIGWDSCSRYVISVTLSSILKGSRNFGFSLRILQPSSIQRFFVDSSVLSPTLKLWKSVNFWYEGPSFHFATWFCRRRTL